MMIEHESAVPLYQQIENDIKDKIIRGEYQAGQMLPSESKFCELYQVSRVTIRNAISDLVEQGILIRKHGKGTFVENQKIPTNLITFSGFTTICRENNIKINTHILCVRRQEASMYDIRALKLKEGADIVYIKRIRYADGHPVIIEHVQLPYREYAFLLNEDLEDRSLYKTIEQNTGANPESYCHTKICLEASAATPEEALFLELQPGNPLFVLKEEIISDSGQPIHWTKQIMSGNYFKFYLSNTTNRLSINID